MKTKRILVIALTAAAMSVSLTAVAKITEEQKLRMAANIDSYLSKDYASEVTDVTVTADKVIIRGVCSGKGQYVLADITPWQDVTELQVFPYTEKIKGKKFKVVVNRQVSGREGIDYDRVFSKWAIVKVDGDKQTLDSHARYADAVAPKASPAPVPLRNKKGFGAGGSDLYFEECKKIDIGSITMNVNLHDLIIAGGNDFSYGGKSYGLGPEVKKVDRIVSKAGETGIVVSAIILTSTDSIFKDPENAGGFYTMPNMTTAEAFNVYAAALEYMAARYCSEDPGRISHWILHNEVDMGHEWTNMGKQPESRFYDRYMKSMRICYNIVRQYDQNAAMLASFTHNWVHGDGDYSPKRLIEKTIRYSQVEGDFWWGIAYHPYPQDLTAPKFWIDDTRSTYSLDSDYITFKNLEVIDAYVKQPYTFYKGKTKRLLFLSENGTNSPSYSDEDLALQAAGGAWAWKKTAKLDGIDAIQWHNWADGRWEFGLRIGLHTFADGPYGDHECKPVWYVWAAAGTDKENEVFDPYMKILGISSWDEIMNEVK